jgi:hypothetical protein
VSVAGMSILRSQKNLFLLITVLKMGVEGRHPGWARSSNVCGKGWIMGYFWLIGSAYTRCMSELDPWAAHRRSRSPKQRTINKATRYIEPPPAVRRDFEQTNLHRCKHLSGGHLELFFFSKDVRSNEHFRERKTHNYALLVVLALSTTNFGL